MLYSHLCVILLLYRYNSDYFQDLVQHNYYYYCNSNCNYRIVKSKKLHVC